MMEDVPRRELRGFELAAFARWASGGMVVQGGRLADHFQSDGVAFANRVLVEAEARGWIVRQRYEPTVEMRVFGVGGFHGRLNATTAPEHAYHVEFAWEIQLSAPLVPPEPPTATELDVVRAQLAELDRHHSTLRERERLEAACWVIDVAEQLTAALRGTKELP